MTLLGPSIMVLSFLARFVFSVYRDGTPPELTYRVPSGPFRGLYTTHPRFLEVTELEQVFKEHEDPAGRVLVYFEYPGAYIFTRMRPAGNTVWPVPNWEQQAALQYYRKHLTGHGFAMKLKDSSKGTPIDRLIEASGPALETTSMFLVFAEPRP